MSDCSPSQHETENAVLRSVVDLLKSRIADEREASSRVSSVEASLRADFTQLRSESLSRISRYATIGGLLVAILSVSTFFGIKGAIDASIEEFRKDSGFKKALAEARSSATRAKEEAMAAVQETEKAKQALSSLQEMRRGFSRFTNIGDSPIGDLKSGITSVDIPIPKEVPIDASEVLIYGFVMSPKAPAIDPKNPNDNGRDSGDVLVSSTDSTGHTSSVRIWVYNSQEEAHKFNSDCVWLPTPKGGKLTASWVGLQRPNSAYAKLRVIGYR